MLKKRLTKQSCPNHRLFRKIEMSKRRSFKRDLQKDKAKYILGEERTYD